MRFGSRPFTIGILTACALCFSSAQVSADPPRNGIRLDLLQPSAPDSVFRRAEGPWDFYSPKSARYAFSLGAEYAKDPLRVVGVDISGGEQVLGSVVDHAVFARLAASIAPTPFLRFDAAIPVALVAGGDAQITSYGGEHPLPASAPGLGDPRVGLHIAALNSASVDILIGGHFWAPLGSSAAYMSDHRFRAELDVGVAGELLSKKLLYGCTVHVAPGFFMDRDGDRVGADCAVHYKVTAALGIGLEPSFAMMTDVDRGGEVRSLWVAEPMAGLHLNTSSLRVGLAAGPGFGGAPGGSELRGMLSLTYIGASSEDVKEAVVQKPKDRDHDEILDEQDACPDEAGPAAANDPSRNGCPAQDQDADGVRDTDDSCPDRAGIKHTDARANGCPDTDNDSAPDPVDTCPNEPGDKPQYCPKYARLSGTSFKINPPIEFRESSLTPVSVAALEEIAATMRANPKYEQVSIALGTKGVKAAISDARAQEIILIFKAGHLDSNRYEVVLKEDVRGGNVTVRINR